MIQVSPRESHFLRIRYIAGAVTALLLPVAASLANPVITGADPDLAVAAKRYWLVATDTGRGPEEHCGQSIYVYVDRDLVRDARGEDDWVRYGPLITLDQISWSRRVGASANCLWAPSLVQRRGRYYLYYSIGPQQGPVRSLIGVAIARSPTGPFTDSGTHLPVEGADFEAIDPMVFVDRRSGKSFLYAGGSDGQKLKVFELHPSMTAIKREVMVQTPPHFTEGPFVHERNGTYYLSYSGGFYNNPTYSVHYATAKTPTGPWEYKGQILKSDDRRKGPGHHAFFRNPSTSEWFIVYHRWDRSDETAPFRGMRVVAIERIHYDRHGAIVDVRMTNEGPSPSEVR